MILSNQSQILSELRRCGENDQHSILIEGIAGCGKTYTAKQYANMLNIDTIISVDPKVDEIRDTIDNCYRFADKILVVVENLDSGVDRSSFMLLKFLEEPPEHVYLIITCRSVIGIPLTIKSRSVCISSSPPSREDVNTYAQQLDFNKYTRLQKSNIWRCIHTYSDVDKIFGLSTEHIDYYNSLPAIFPFKDNVSSIIWKLSHFEDGSEIDINIMCSILLSTLQDVRIKRHCINLSKDLSYGSLSKHAVLAKFVLECKYGE